jgi:hypothetical protein
VLLGEESCAYTKYLEGNKDFVITYVVLTRYKELKYVLRFVEVYCATLKMARYEESVTVYMQHLYPACNFYPLVFVDVNAWLCLQKMF